MATNINININTIDYFIIRSSIDDGTFNLGIGVYKDVAILYWYN